jgi:aldose 1-epimerase
LTVETVVVQSDDGGTSATFAPGAGMVCCSLTHAGEELLDQRRGLETYASAGKTMGIPLLYPWANRLARSGYRAAGRDVSLPEDPGRIPREEHGLPIHGVLPSLMAWEAGGGASELRARLRWDRPELLELFPFAHEAALEVSVASGAVAITTTVRAAADDPVPVSFGFHPYLRLPGSRSECWVRLPESRRMLLDDQSVPTGEREPLEPLEFQLQGSSWDDGLEIGVQPSRYAVGAGARTVALELVEGFPYGQVFSPDGREFICFEPMTAPSNALVSGDGLTVLDPGEEYRAQFRILVEGG